MMRLPQQEILRFIAGTAATDRSVLIGIDGGAGSGKTTFTRRLAEWIQEIGTTVSTVHTDAFCRPCAERQDPPLTVVSDIDWERLRDQVLAPLRSGRTARFQLYDWPADRLRDWVTIEVGGVVIVDGIAATRTELADHYDLRVWFSCPREVRISRMLGRGDTSAEEIEHWMPSEDDYIAVHAPEAAAHLVVDSVANRATRWAPPDP